MLCRGSRKSFHGRMVLFPDQTRPPPTSQPSLPGGDGPKRRLLEEMVRQEGLQQRVELVGAVPHELARDFLVRTANAGLGMGEGIHTLSDKCLHWNWACTACACHCCKWHMASTCSSTFVVGMGCREVLADCMVQP